MVPTIIEKRTTPGTPFITNGAKEVYSKQREEKPKTESKNKKATVSSMPYIPKQVDPNDLANGQTILKLEMIAPSNKQERPMGIVNPTMPTVDMTGNKRFVPSLYENLFEPTSAVSMGPSFKMPIQNNYTINLPGPTGSHVEMNRIYEMFLPGKEGKLSFNTLGERLQMYHFIHQVLIHINEGEDMSLDNSGHNSIMSYVKFMEMNPNYYSVIYSNPYKGLSYGLLIYRSCFPIRVDDKSQSIICAKDSIGMNIRIYSLSEAELGSYKLRDKFYQEYDVWRELAYYEYMREYVLKKKQSPNFPLLYAFFFCPNKTVDFFSLKKACLTQKDFMTKEYQKFVEYHRVIAKNISTKTMFRPMDKFYREVDRIQKLPDEIDPMLQLYSGTTLMVITEAPHQNLYQWSSRLYEKRGIKSKMVSTGFHNESVWLNVLFQIVAGLYVMQVHGIYIREMTIEDNIYIKDLQNYGNTSGYWKYIINGISYYIPAQGYLVMIDSNYKDIIQSNRIVPCKREYKIYTSNMIGKKYKLADIQQKVYENYTRIVSTNAFTKEFTQNELNKPPDSVMQLLGIMMTDTETNLSKILVKYFRRFLHNRIGTYLRKDSEIPNIREITGKFEVGELAIEVIDDQVYKWCLIHKVRPDGIIEIITREKPDSQDFIDKTVRIETLKQYSITETVDQNIINGINLSDEKLLETYTISQ